MKNELLILILQNLVLFPNQEIKLELNNSFSKNIIDIATREYENCILVISPRDTLEVRPNIEDLPSIASYARITTKLILPNGNIRVNLRGVKRVGIKSYRFIDSEKGLIKADIEALPIPRCNLEEENAYIKKLRKMVENYVALSNNVSNSILEILKSVTSLNKMTDVIAAYLDFPFQARYELFGENNYYERAKRLVVLLGSEISSIELDKKLDDEIRTNLENSEKEILIKEKIDLLSRELGMNPDVHKECEEYLTRLKSLHLDTRIENDLKREIKRLETTLETSPEFGMIRGYLDFVINLPWCDTSIDFSDAEAFEEHLNRTHYGFRQAKERLKEHLLLKRQNRSLHSPILCLVGPPGTGKTTFAREIAKSLGREFIKINVGGLSDPAELLGHRRTYVGATPGKIMVGLRKVGVKNPVVLIDEVDKIMKDYRGNPADVLLDILDRNENSEFIDNYVSEPFDLSGVIFILAANDSAKIPIPLLDRCEIIEINSYTIFEKVAIAQNYLLPKLGEKYSFDYSKIGLTDKVLVSIIEEYTDEAGIRELERKLDAIIRKILIKGLNKNVNVKEKDLSKYLGNGRASFLSNHYRNSGIVNVPACNDTGGTVLNIECSIYDGPEKIISTGSLGEVMKESILVVLSFLKSHRECFKIKSSGLSRTIHVHALDGASKKDGPSAGLAIAVAMMSEITKRIVPDDIAFTGEMSLDGRILKVGGIKEKVICSYNRGIKRLFIPKDNEVDLKEVPNNVLKNIEVILVDNFIEVYENLTMETKKATKKSDIENGKKIAD